jgi:hypothetical protein
VISAPGTHPNFLEAVKGLAGAVRERGVIELANVSVADPMLRQCLEMLADGIDLEDVRRHHDRCSRVERAQLEQRLALRSAALDLIATGEAASYIDFTFGPLMALAPCQTDPAFFVTR